MCDSVQYIHACHVRISRANPEVSQAHIEISFLIFGFQKFCMICEVRELDRID